MLTISKLLVSFSLRIEKVDVALKISPLYSQDILVISHRSLLTICFNVRWMVISLPHTCPRYSTPQVMLNMFVVNSLFAQLFHSQPSIFFFLAVLICSSFDLQPLISLHAILQILTALLRVLVSQPPFSISTRWHIGWVLGKLLRYHDTKFTEHDIDLFNVRHELVWDAYIFYQSFWWVKIGTLDELECLHTLYMWRIREEKERNFDEFWFWEHGSRGCLGYTAHLFIH